MLAIEPFSFGSKEEPGAEDDSRAPRPEGRGAARASRSRIVALVALLAATNLWLLEKRSQPVSDYAYFAASAMLWIAAIPFARFLVANRRTFPFLPVAAMLYWLYFGFPVFGDTPMFLLLVRTGPAWESMDDAIGLALAGLICMLVGYGAGPLLGAVPRIRREMDLRRSIPILALITVASLCVRVASTGATTRVFGSTLYALGEIGQMTLGALVVAWIRGYLSPGYKAFTACMAAAIAAVCAASSLLATVAMPMAGLLFIYGWERGRIPWIPVLVGALLFVPFDTAKQEFRAVAWHDARSQLGPANIPKLVTLFVSITIDQVVHGRSAEDESGAAHARANELATLAVVVGETPRYVPYWDGYTYSDLLWHLIPRLLVPDKPSPAVGQEFPRRYGIIEYFDYETSVNLSQLVELYVNFGPFGVVMGMSAIGFLYRAIDHIFSASSGGAVIGAVVFSSLMNMESNFSLVFGGVPFFALLCYGLLRLLPAIRA